MGRAFSSSLLRAIIAHNHLPFGTHSFSRKGPINSALSICSSVRSFVRNTDISGSTCQNFLIVCTKLEQHNCRKVMFFDFRKKLLTPCGQGQKVKFGPKLDFFFLQRLLLNCAPEFFDFLHEVRQ